MFSTDKPPHTNLLSARHLTITGVSLNILDPRSSNPTDITNVLIASPSSNSNLVKKGDKHSFPPSVSHTFTVLGKGSGGGGELSRSISNVQAF